MVLGLACAGLSGAVGCNLGVDPADHPYRGPLVVIERDAATVEPDATPDAGPPGEPRLVITEVLIDTSFIDNRVGSGELGEYIEVKNVGTAPADPQGIQFRLTRGAEGDDAGVILVARPIGQEELEVVNGLQPIEPGDYFVFLRHSVAEVPVGEVIGDGAFYDYGRYGDDASLANIDRRTLALQYTDGQRFWDFDQLVWDDNLLLDAAGGPDTLPIVEDLALGVRPGHEDPEGNDSPSVWCQHAAPMAGAGTVPGSPGAPTICAP